MHNSRYNHIVFTLFFIISSRCFCSLFLIVVTVTVASAVLFFLDLMLLSLFSLLLPLFLLLQLIKSVKVLEIC